MEVQGLPWTESQAVTTLASCQNTFLHMRPCFISHEAQPHSIRGPASFHMSPWLIPCLESGVSPGKICECTYEATGLMLSVCKHYFSWCTWAKPLLRWWQNHRPQPAWTGPIAPADPAGPAAAGPMPPAHPPPQALLAAGQPMQVDLDGGAPTNVAQVVVGILQSMQQTNSQTLTATLGAIAQNSNAQLQSIQSANAELVNSVLQSVQQHAANAQTGQHNAQLQMLQVMVQALAESRRPVPQRPPPPFPGHVAQPMPTAGAPNTNPAPPDPAAEQGYPWRQPPAAEAPTAEAAPQPEGCPFNAATDKDSMYI